MNKALIEKLLVAALSGGLGTGIGAIGTYYTKAVAIEGRLSGIERSVARIECRLFPCTPTATTAPPAPVQDRQ